MKYADVRKFYNKYKKDLSIDVIINLCLVLLKKREVIQIVKTTKPYLEILLIKQLKQLKKRFCQETYKIN